MGRIQFLRRRQSPHRHENRQSRLAFKGQDMKSKLGRKVVIYGIEDDTCSEQQYETNDKMYKQFSNCQYEYIHAFVQVVQSNT
jgi:hypothetical protein